MALSIGVDVGGTKIAAGVVDEEGVVLATVRRDSPTIDREAVVETIAAVANELVAQYDAPHRRHRRGRLHLLGPQHHGPRHQP